MEHGCVHWIRNDPNDAVMNARSPVVVQDGFGFGCLAPATHTVVCACTSSVRLWHRERQSCRSLGKGGGGGHFPLFRASPFSNQSITTPPPRGSGHHSNCTDPSQAARQECAEVNHVDLDTYFLASSFWRSSGFGGADLITMQAEPTMCLEKKHPVIGQWNDHSVSWRARYLGSCSVGESER